MVSDVELRRRWRSRLDHVIGPVEPSILAETPMWPRSSQATRRTAMDFGPSVAGLASAIRSPHGEFPHAGLLLWRHVAVGQPVFDSGGNGLPGGDRVDADQERMQQDAPADRDDEPIDSAHGR